MADWLSSLLAGLGAGAESLGTSMTEREKRTAAAKQRAFELAMQQADKNAELGITDIAPVLPSEAAKTKLANTIERIGARGTPQSLDMLSEQLGLRPAVGGQVQKFTTPSPDFSIGGPTPDMSDAATNYEVSRTGASTFGSRPTSPRFDNFTDQTVLPAATPASGGGASASIAKMLQPEMAPPVSKAAAPVSAAEQDLIDYGNQVRANPKARQTLASVMKGKTPEEQAVYMADRLTAGKLPAARQVEFDKIKAMGPQAYLNDVEIRMTPDMGPPSSLAGSDTPPTAPPSDPSAAPMAPAAGPRTVSALGAPTMPRLRLGSIPDVQSQLPAPSMTTGGVDEGASTIMQYDPQHPELGPLRKRIDYKQGTDYLATQATTKANEERDAARQQATYEREAALDREKNARTLKDKAAAADDLARQSQVVLQAFGSKHPLAKKDYETMTQAEKNSLKPIADATVKIYEENSKISASAAARPEKSKSVWVMDPKDPTKTILVSEEDAIRQGFSRAPTGGGSGGTGGSGASGMSLSANARLLAGMNEAQRAKARMDAFEDDWLNKKVNPSLFNNVTANYAQLSPKDHPFASALGQAGTQLTKDSARWEQYKRDAALIARAEQLISSRGGSESSVAANTSLASAVPGAGYEESIKAARASREALFGEYGGIMQALSTNTALRDKLIEGLEAAKRNEDNFKYSDVGKEVEKYRQSAPAAPRTRLERAPTASSATSDPYQALVPRKP